MAIDTFDWYGEDVAVPQQQAIAVYENQRGEIVIRQRDQYDDESDLIYVSKTNILTLVKKLLAAAGMERSRLYRESGDGSFAACSDIDLPTLPGVADKAKPKDPTAAERQRRYRQRKKKRDAVAEGLQSEQSYDEEYEEFRRTQLRHDKRNSVTVTPDALRGVVQ